MSQTGKLLVRTYASNMLIPIEGSKVTVTKPDTNKELIAFRITDKDGKTDEIEIETPDFKLSQDDQYNEIPFTSVNIKVEKEGYDISTIEDVQIFPDNLSIQNVEMIPLPENSDFDKYQNKYTVTPQNL